MRNLKENNVQMNVVLDWEKENNAVKNAAAKSIGVLFGRGVTTESCTICWN